MLKFNVRNQSISRIDNFRPAEKSIKYLLAQFDFKTEDWKETVKTAVFRNTKTGKPYDAILDENTCVVPWEVLSESGVFEVSVYGIKDDGSRITTDIDVVNLNSTIYGGSATHDPSPTVYETLVLGIDKLENKVGELEDKFENFEPSQPGGTGGNITVDSELSTESENPVQNKVVAKKFGELDEDIEELSRKVEEGNVTSEKITTALGYTPANQEDVGRLSQEIGDLQVFVTPEMYGAKGDGVTDDTEAIVSAVKTGKPVHFNGNSTYYMQGVALEDNTEVYGNGCTILFTGYQANDVSGKVCFGVVGKQNVIIDGFCLIPQNHVVADIFMQDSSSVQVKNCNLQGNSILDGVYHEDGANQGVQIRHSEYITVENCIIQNIYSMGLPISHSSSHITISKCRFENTGRGGAYVMGGNTDIDICDNIFINCVKSFTVADGAIDVYGDTATTGALRNDTIRIIGNYIEGFGRDHERGYACGIRIKGSTNVVCAENTIKTDINTKISSAIVLHDRNGVNVSDCVIRDNYIFVNECVDNHWSEGIDFAYLIRLQDIETAENILITGNTLKSNHHGVTGIHLRDKCTNLIISDNNIATGDYYGIRSHNSADTPKKNVRILNNTIEGRVQLAYCDGVYVYDNKITDNTSEVASLQFINSNDGNYCRNQIYSSAENHVSLDVCVSIEDGGDNVFYDKDGRIVTTANDSSPFKTIESADVTIENLYKDTVVGVKCHGDIVFDANVSTDNVVDYQVFNSDGSYRLIVDGTINVPDSVKKLALKTTSVAHANYTNENGDMYVSDYRDWASGVDWHLLHELVLTGEERYRESDFPAIILTMGGEYKPKPVGGDYNRYKTPYLSNFYYSAHPYPMYSSNNSQLTIFERVYEHGFESLDAFKSYCREMYNAGTPLKIIYLLEIPYTTPIPQDELLAYNNANIGEGTVITNNLNKPFRVSYLTNNDVVVAIDEMIRQSISNSTPSTEEKLEHICTITTDGVNKVFSILNSIGNVEKLSSVLAFVKLPAGCISSVVSGWGRFTFKGNGNTISSTKLNGVGGADAKETYFIVEAYIKNKIWRSNYTLPHGDKTYATALYGDVLSQIETPRYCDDDRYKYIDTIEFNNVPMEGIEIKVMGVPY